MGGSRGLRSADAAAGRTAGTGPGRYGWILLLVAACGTATTNDTTLPPAVASATVDRAVATTGDVITYTLAVEHAPGVKVEIPEAGGEIAGFRIIDSGRNSSEAAGPRPGRGSGREVVSRWYQLRADLVGSYVLPAVEVTYRVGEAAPKTLSTSAIFVEVKSVLPADGEATDIRDVKPLEPLAPSRVWLWASLAGLVVLAALAYWLWRRRRRAGERLPPALPPHELAFAALARLRQTNFEDPEALRRYYFEISEVVRTYVEGRFAVNATDLTTEEILRRLGGLTELDVVSAESLRRFLLDTDQVKFAAHKPTESEIADTYERALALVETTQPRPEPAAEESAKAA